MTMVKLPSIERELSGADFGDDRLSRALVRVGKGYSADPTKSLPKLFPAG